MLTKAMVLSNNTLPHMYTLWLSNLAVPGTWLGRFGKKDGGLVIAASQYGFLRVNCGNFKVGATRCLDFSTITKGDFHFDYVNDPSE